MAALARYALWNPRFRAIVRTQIKHVPWSKPIGEKIYVNKNHLLGAYPGADGVKTGWTTMAKHCLVASAHRKGIHLIAVILGSDDSYRTSGSSSTSASRVAADPQLLRVCLFGLVNRVCAVPFPAVDHQCHRLVDVVGGVKQVDVLGRDHPGRQGLVCDPVEQVAPVRAPKQDDGELANLVRLDQRQRFEQLVERPEAAGEEDEPSAAFTSATLRA